MNPFDRVKSPQPPPPGEDDLIDLTEVMEDGEPLELTDEAADEVAAEVVLDFRDGTDGIAALKAPAAPPEEAPPTPPAAPPEESLDDFLASLPELPEELDIPDNTLSLRAAAASDPPPDLPPDLAGRLDEAELQDLVRRVVQETVERLARELVPPLAAEAIERELARVKKRLAEPD